MRVVLKPGRDFSVRAGHPWVFSGAIARVEGEDAPGRPAQVCAADGRVLGWGTWNPATSIAIRMMTRGARPIDAALVHERIGRALALRTLVADTDAVRLVNGEGDGLPGLVVDRYADFAVCQFLTAGADALRGDVVAALAASAPVRGIFERSEGNVRTAEGLVRRVGSLHGEEPPAEVVIAESGRRHVVDVRGGQKTGFFLDQRPNRDLVGRLAAGRRVLNLFAYSGGFSIAAARGGAVHVASVDSSAAALALAEAAWRLNGLADGLGTFVRADVFEYLRDDRASGGEVPPPDLVVLDPPPFARRRADRERARAGYKDVNLHALRAAAPGALVLTFSCSQHVAVEEWEGAVAAAAMDAGRACQLLARLGPGIDHPQALAHAEGRYLKGLLLRTE
ncbi:MAG: class I SAM-dependent rRNA methyltransferase [Deltaproteobacteria bacterium]|nr:class I SAM-dependent rRNA methyltransferase [Deltaproteobacteria bacterium]